MDDPINMAQKVSAVSILQNIHRYYTRKIKKKIYVVTHQR